MFGDSLARFVSGAECLKDGRWFDDQVDEVNLKGASLLVRKVFGLGAEGAGGCW